MLLRVKPGIGAERGDIARRARHEVVYAENVHSTLEERGTEMGADESGSAGDESVQCSVLSGRDLTLVIVWLFGAAMAMEGK